MDLGINPGYIAVFFGLVLFYMGYLKGKDVGREQGAGGMIDMLHHNGYLKVKGHTIDEKGNPQIEFAKIDE
tara:strand:+ start:813 stop:1025 length:213 start_codon:yes stop_codon:yes gene_type:complete